MHTIPTQIHIDITHTLIYIHMRIITHVTTCTCIHTYIYTQTDTNIYTHTDITTHTYIKETRMYVYMCAHSNQSPGRLDLKNCYL